LHLRMLGVTATWELYQRRIVGEEGVQPPRKRELAWFHKRGGASTERTKFNKKNPGGRKFREKTRDLG